MSDDRRSANDPIHRMFRVLRSALRTMVVNIAPRVRRQVELVEPDARHRAPPVDDVARDTVSEALNMTLAPDTVSEALNMTLAPDTLGELVDIVTGVVTFRKEPDDE